MLSEPTEGRAQSVEVTDWYCPSERRWVWCPGPCPDGTPHSESRTYTVEARRYEQKGPRHV